MLRRTLKNYLSHWELCEGTRRAEFFRGESKKCVKKFLETEIFSLQAQLSERGDFFNVDFEREVTFVLSEDFVYRGL